jgi:hypothetical protein
MTYYKPLHIIHWEHKYPTDYTSTASAEPNLTVIPIQHIKTKAKMGLRFRWTLRIVSKKEHILSFIAEQDFIFADAIDRKEDDIWDYVRASHLYYREEFEKRREPIGLYFTIVPVKKAHVDFKGIISLLRD